MASGVLVIGAGVAGLAAVKACKEEGLAVTCYEREGEFGGLWRYRGAEKGGRGGSVMRSTVSNTSKEMSSFSDFPAPESFPTFMPHALVLRYLHLYADKFDLLSHVTYHQEVVSLAPTEDYETTGAWGVAVRDLRTGAERRERFAGVAACSGHHAAPLTPAYRGAELFDGRTMHSREYRTPSGMEGKEVLVVGLGNSGADVAVEIAGVANNVYLSTRKGSWIFTRAMEKGKPFDVCLNRRCRALLPASWAADRLQKRLTDRMDHDRFGVRPPHPPPSQHPTINDELQAKLLNGSVKLRRDIKEFVADGVIFEGDTEVTPVEVVVSATGYHIALPFLSEEVLKVGPHNEVLLYKKVFPPQLEHHTLGVLWMGDEAIPGSVNTLQALSKMGKRIIYVTNNSTKSRPEYFKKIENLGFPANLEYIFPSSYCAAAYLEARNFTKKAYVVGTSGITKELERVGIRSLPIGPEPVFDDWHKWACELQLDTEVGAVVVGFDVHMNHAKITKAASYLKDPNCIFIATNRDEQFPSRCGRLIMPGAGMCVAAIEVVAGRKAICLGKPERYMIEVIKSKHPDIDIGRSIMIGDRLSTDILFGTSNGLRTLFVLTGINSLEDVEALKKSSDEKDRLQVPDHYLPCLGDLLEFIKT